MSAFRAALRKENSGRKRHRAVICFVGLSWRGLSVGAVGLVALAIGAAGCGIDVQGELDIGQAGTGAETSGGSGGATGGDGGTGATAAVGGTGGTSGTGGGSGGSGAAGFGGAGTCAGGKLCVPQAPSGWSYGFLAGAAYSPTAPPGELCWDGAAPHRYFTDPTGPGACTACSCGSLAGGVCTVPLLCAGNTSCSSFQDYTQNNTDCHGDTNVPTTLACMLGGPTFVSVGSCATAGGQLTSPDAWKQVADVCTAVAEGTCGSGGTCVPPGGGSYQGYVCIYMPGAQQCPAEYPASTVVYGEADDTRACSPCVCTPSAPACTGASYKFYDDGFCVSGGQTVNTASCTDVTGQLHSGLPGWGYEKSGDPVVTGSCTPSGGTASGTAQGKAASALTVCCRSSS